MVINLEANYMYGWTIYRIHATILSSITVSNACTCRYTHTHTHTHTHIPLTPPTHPPPHSMVSLTNFHQFFIFITHTHTHTHTHTYVRFASSSSVCTRLLSTPRSGCQRQPSLGRAQTSSLYNQGPPVPGGPRRQTTENKGTVS